MLNFMMYSLNFIAKREYRTDLPLAAFSGSMAYLPMVKPPLHTENRVRRMSDPPAQLTLAYPGDSARFKTQEDTHGLTFFPKLYKRTAHAQNGPHVARKYQ